MVDLVHKHHHLLNLPLANLQDLVAVVVGSEGVIMVDLVPNSLQALDQLLDLAITAMVVVALVLVLPTRVALDHHQVLARIAMGVDLDPITMGRALVAEDCLVGLCQV